MLQGANATQKGYVCLSCNNIVAEFVEDLPNYCPHCGAPLQLSTMAQKEKQTRQTMEKVVEMFEKQDNGKTTLTQAISIVKQDIEK